MMLKTFFHTFPANEVIPRILEMLEAASPLVEWIHSQDEENRDDLLEDVLNLLESFKERRTWGFLPSWMQRFREEP